MQTLSGLGRVADTRVRIVAPSRIVSQYKRDTKYKTRARALNIIGSLVISLIQYI